MKWRKPETRREKRERIQAEKAAPVRVADELTAERQRFTVWCQEAEEIILSKPEGALVQQKAAQLLLAAQHKHDLFAEENTVAGPENGWKTRDSGENWQRAGQAGHHYIEACFPGLSEALYLFRSGAQGYIMPLVNYLEASPRFYCSGYIAEFCIRYVRRAELNVVQEQALRFAVLKATDNQDRFVLKHYCRLARTIDTPTLRDLLQARIEQGDRVISRRAAIVLHSLTEKDAGR